MDPTNLMVSHSPGSVSDLVSRNVENDKGSFPDFASVYTHTQESTSTSACAHAYKTK